MSQKIHRCNDQASPHWLKHARSSAHHGRKNGEGKQKERGLFILRKGREELLRQIFVTVSCLKRGRVELIMAKVPENKNGLRLKKRYKKHGGSLFTFMKHPEITPDNNSSERALRPIATYLITCSFI